MSKLFSARKSFHADVLSQILTISTDGIPNVADKGSASSVQIARAIVNKIGHANVAKKGAGQTAGSKFETVCAEFIEKAFADLAHIRPGSYKVTKGGSIAQFDQYAHLDELEEIAKNVRDVATALGSDYIIKPDIVISKEPLADDELNRTQVVVDASVARLTSLRAANHPLPTLHASISCKWTLRSDRAQNARSEGLNLVRNRKGHLPHVAVITAEPTPGRIASLALGTGDIDCVYHFALPELKEALEEQGRLETLELLNMMIDGKRLRDISDLPLDLAI
jgi:hypothetical protein